MEYTNHRLVENHINNEKNVTASPTKKKNICTKISHKRDDNPDRRWNVGGRQLDHPLERTTVMEPSKN